MLCFTFVLAVQLAALSSYCDASADTSVRPSPASEVAVVNAGVDDRQCSLSSTKPIPCSGDIPINCSAPGTIDYVFQMRNTTAAEFQNVTADDNKSCLSANYTSGIGLYTFTPGDLDYQRVFKCIAYDANGASINEIQVLVEFHSDEKSTWKLKSGPSQTEGDAELKYSSGDSFSAPQATGVCSSDFTLGRNRLDYTVCFLDEKESDLYDVAHTPCLLARGVIRCCRCGSICPGLPNVTTKATKLGNDKLACHVSTSQVGQIVCLGKIVNSNDNSQYITNQVIGSYKTVLSSPHSQNLDLPEWSYFLFGVTGLLIVSVPLLSAIVVAVHCMRRRKRRAGYQPICDGVEGAGDRDAPVDNRPDNTQQTVGVPPSRRCPPAAKGMSSLDPSGSRTFTPGPAQGSDESERMGSGVQDTKSPSDSTFSDQFKALDEHPVKIHLLAQFICDMAPQWLPIATQLGPKVSEKAHSDIDKRQCFDNEKMTRVLNSWIDSGENVCWSNILSVIHKVDLHSALAQEMLKLLPDLLTSQAKPSVDAERYDGIPVSLTLVADFVQRMCVEWYRIAFYFGGRTAIEAHGQIDLDPSPASTKMSKVIEVWIDSVDGDVRWSVLNDALRTVGLGGVANDIRKKLDEQLSQLDSDGGPKDHLPAGVASGSSSSLPSKIPAVEGVHAKPTAPELWKHAGQHMHSEWYKFGVVLQVSENILKSIKQENLLSGSKDCFISLSQQWLRRGNGTGEELRTWRTVLEAVKECGFPDLAKEVKKLIHQGKLNEPEPSGSDYSQPPGVLWPLSALEGLDSKSPMYTVCHKRRQPQVVYINNGKSSLIRSRPKLPSDSSGYKLCRNMGDRKVCPRGPTCSFAHSEAELKYWFYAKVKSEPRRRQPAAGGAMFHYSSKLQMCNSVVAEPYGYCRHGTNCIFPHSKEELDLWQEQRNYLSPPLDNIGPKPVLATPSALCYMESRSNGYEYGDVHAHSKEELKAWNQTSTSSNDCSDDVTQVSEVQQLETKSVDCDSSRGLEDDVDVFACNSDNSLSEDTCIEQYKKALRENAYVTVGIVKAMTIGPPRVGKTCLRSLLLGQVPPKNSPSTSVLKTAETVSIQDPAQKTIVSHCISTSGWEVVDTTSGIISLLKYLQEGKHNSHGNSETSHSEKRPRYPSGSEGKSPGDDLSQTPDTTNKVAMQSLDSESLIPVEGRDGPLTPDQKLFAEQIYQVISQSSEQPGVKLLDANLLQFLDTGGQISYHDILPVFITTPAIYFHVFNIMKDLDKRPKDCIQLEDDEQDSVTSPLTTLEMISRSAITVHSLANKNIQLPCFVNDKYYPKPKMVIVGTHMDELLRSNKEPEEELKKNSKKLDSALSGLKFSIIKRKFDDKEQMFHPVNNYMYESNPDTIDRQQKETIERLRKEIERIAADMKFKIPVPWYLQQLLLTKENDTKPFYKYSDLLDLCKNNGVVRSNLEFYAMISLFHNLGLVVHHDVGEEPKDEASHGDFSECLVFTNPSFLYENISRLYAVQFETCHGWKLSLKDQGLLQASVLPEIKVDESLTPEWFMDLLVTLFIGAEVTNCRKFKERTLFVPSVLLPNTQPSVPTNNVKLALMFEISSAFASHRGETYIPCGIFTGTIARLQSRDDWQVSRYGRISRSSITFQVGNDGTYVKLSDCTQYITFEILTYEVSEDSERCQKLRDVVFDDILESYKYLFEKDAQSVLVIGLPCSKTDHQNHIAPLTTTAEYSRFCVKCPYTRQTVTIDPSTHQIRSAEKELEDRELSIFLCISHPAVKKEFHTPAQKNTDRVKKAVSEESSSGATTPTDSSQAKTLSKPCAANQKQVVSSPSESWKDEKPTEIQLRKHVCKHITGNYQEVCTYLGIPHTKIKGIRQDNQTSPLEQTVFECLLVWHSGNSEKHRPCWKVLLKAIKDAEHGDLVTDLTDKLDKGELDD